MIYFVFVVLKIYLLGTKINSKGWIDVSLIIEGNDNIKILKLSINGKEELILNDFFWLKNNEKRKIVLIDRTFH